MNRFSLREKLNRVWLSLSIRRKLLIHNWIMALMLMISIIVSISTVYLTADRFQSILDDNAKTSQLAGCLETESRLFSGYIRNMDAETGNAMAQAFIDSQAAIEALPFSYREIGPYRYARTWSIKNSYAYYSRKRTEFLLQGEGQENYLNNLYLLYDMQKYLQAYAADLRNMTQEAGAKSYEANVPLMQLLPVLILIISAATVAGVVYSSQKLRQIILVPVEHLADAAKKIAVNDFYISDIEVDNQDEIGDLVYAFNKMKYATGQYILNLESQREFMELYHREQLQKLEMEKSLEAANLKLLKSQLHPHFLFNTLNVIAGMANIEDAETTEKMIRALSAILRYNLSAPEARVSLGQELRYVEDYLYLQKMRFGNRLSYNIDCQVDRDRVIMPSFTFQPLVENSIIHGISKKEEGGKIVISICRENDRLKIVIADDGTGIPEDTLTGIRAELDSGAGERVGIGLGNIYKRIRTEYPDSSFTIESCPGKGTTITILLPIETELEMVL